MKWVNLILVISVLALGACSNSGEKTDKVTTDIVQNPNTADGNVDSGNLPVFQFAAKTHDFGVIYDGEKVAWTFKFKNVGKTDLVIASAKGSCGCTVPKFNKEPVPPGHEGYIEVIFDSSGRNGMQNKTVTLIANTQPNSETLTITGEVVNPNKK